jgi:hypothetical protein
MQVQQQCGLLLQVPRRLVPEIPKTGIEGWYR